MSHTKLFIIAGAIAAAIVGVIYFDNIRPAQAPTEQNNDLAADETSDWKTYRDVDLGFELDYPGSLTPMNLGALIVFSNGEQGAFRLEVNTGSLRVCAHFEGDVSEEKVSISGTEATKIECGDDVEYSFWKQSNSFFIGSNRKYLDREVFDQILSTFKFIDPKEMRLLATVVNSGGLCADGSCHWQTAIYNDGVIIVEGKSQQLTNSELAIVISAIKSADFDEIRSTPFTGTCPAAYDGPSYSFDFSTDHGFEHMNSCETELDMQEPLLKAVSDIVKKYSGITLRPYP